MTITRSKHGVPQWDGDPATIAEFKDEALLYEATVKRSERETVVPRLCAELTGQAKAAIKEAPSSELPLL